MNLDMSSESPNIWSNLEQLDTSPAHFGELRRSDDIAHDFDALRARMAEDGYLYVPGLLNREDVYRARTSILEKLNEEGFINERFELDAAKAKPDIELAFRPDLANGNKAVEDLVYSGQVMAFYSGLLGGPSMHYDYTWLRAVAPGGYTPPHYDIVYMGRGTKNIFTAWVPMSDISYHVGGLMILENSHRWEELKSTYGQMDVDEVCSNKEMTRRIEDLGYGFGHLTESPNEVRKMLGTRWLTAEFKMGDLLTFSMFTLHASTDNNSDVIRLSTDTRYQLASEPADPRWMGEDPPGHGPRARKEMVC